MIRNDYSRGFALALFSLAQDDNKLVNYKCDAQDIIKALEPHPWFLALLNRKGFAFEKKNQLIKLVFGTIDNSNIKNLIALLINKSQIKMFMKILWKLISLINTELKIKEGIIYSTSLLSSRQIKKLEDFVSFRINSQVELKNHIDHTLVSGFKIVIDDTIIENNVLSRLKQIEQNLIGGLK